MLIDKITGRQLLWLIRDICTQRGFDNACNDCPVHGLCAWEPADWGADEVDEVDKAVTAIGQGKEGDR